MPYDKHKKKDCSRQERGDRGRVCGRDLRRTNKKIGSKVHMLLQDYCVGVQFVTWSALAHGCEATKVNTVCSFECFLIKTFLDLS
jgi:hypothetical protein